MDKLQTYGQTLADCAAIVLAELDDDTAGARAALAGLLADPDEARRVAHAALALAGAMARKELTARAELGSVDVPPSLEYVVVVARQGGSLSGRLA